MMCKDAEELFVQQPLLNAVVVVQARLRAPADVHRAMDVAQAPVHHLTQLVQ